MGCKLSIIIPVYNVEKYISACLDSVVNQEGGSNVDYEVIVVNDGSPDRSIDIINSFEWKRCQHKVISQENKGLSGARNKGLEYASGDYIWFVDSDDYITSDAVCKILDIVDGNDIVNIGYQEEMDGFKGKLCLPDDCKNGKDCIMKGFSQPAQFHVFKRLFLDENNLRFMEGIYHEDAEFTSRCLYIADKIGTIKECVYYYQIRDDSIMTTIKPKRAFDYLTVAESLIKFILNHGESVSSTPLLNTICLIINNALFIISQSDKTEQKKWNDKYNSNHLFTDALMESPILKYKLEGCLFKVLPISRVFLYKLLTKFKK